MSFVERREVTDFRSALKEHTKRLVALYRDLCGEADREKGSALYSNYRKKSWTEETYNEIGFQLKYIQRLYEKRARVGEAFMFEIRRLLPSLSTTPLRIADISGGPGCVAHGILSAVNHSRLEAREHRHQLRSVTVLDPSDNWAFAVGALAATCDNCDVAFVHTPADLCRMVQFEAVRKSNICIFSYVLEDFGRNLDDLWQCLVSGAECKQMIVLVIGEGINFAELDGPIRWYKVGPGLMGLINLELPIPCHIADCKQWPVPMQKHQVKMHFKKSEEEEYVHPKQPINAKQQALLRYQGFWWIERYGCHAHIKGGDVFRGDGHHSSLKVSHESEPLERTVVDYCCAELELLPHEGNDVLCRKGTHWVRPHADHMSDLPLLEAAAMASNLDELEAVAVGLEKGCSSDLVKAILVDLEIAKVCRRSEELVLAVHDRLVAALKRGLTYREIDDKVKAMTKHRSQSHDERQFLSQDEIERLSEEELASVLLKDAGRK